MDHGTHEACGTPTPPLRNNSIRINGNFGQLVRTVRVVSTYEYISVLYSVCTLYPLAVSVPTPSYPALYHRTPYVLVFYTLRVAKTAEKIKYVPHKGTKSVPTRKNFQVGASTKVYVIFVYRGDCSVMRTYEYLTSISNLNTY